MRLDLGPCRATLGEEVLSENVAALALESTAVTV